jgi:cytochrome c biogenesis protein CcdA
VSGLILLGIITIRLPAAPLSQKHRAQLAESGAGGAFLLGFIFALAFCPVSAALFFGSLIPLAISSKSSVFLPLIYGVGTGLPVFGFAAALALGVTSLSHWFNKITKLEYYSRKITGVIFVAVGLYYAYSYFLPFMSGGE